MGAATSYGGSTTALLLQEPIEENDWSLGRAEEQDSEQGWQGRGGAWGAGALGARGAKKWRPLLGRGALQNFGALRFKTDTKVVGLELAILSIQGSDFASGRLSSCSQHVSKQNIYNYK